MKRDLERAMRRYPKEPCAIIFYESDKRRAGIGALDERRRDPHGTRNGRRIVRIKQIDPLTGEWRYYISTTTPRMYREPAFDQWDPSQLFDSREHTGRIIESITEHLYVAAFREEIEFDRTKIAARLVYARRLIRRRINERLKLNEVS